MGWKKDYVKVWQCGNVYFKRREINVDMEHVSYLANILYASILDVKVRKDSKILFICLLFIIIFLGWGS